MRQACAPRARAFRTSAPVRMPLSSQTSVLPTAGDFGQHPDRRQRPVELPSAVVRHDDRIGAKFGGSTRVIGVEDALEDDLAAPHDHDACDLVPVELGVELLDVHADE